MRRVDRGRKRRISKQYGTNADSKHRYDYTDTQLTLPMTTTRSFLNSSIHACLRLFYVLLSIISCLHSSNEIVTQSRIVLQSCTLFRNSIEYPAYNRRFAICKFEFFSLSIITPFDRSIDVTLGRCRETFRKLHKRVGGKGTKRYDNSRKWRVPRAVNVKKSTSV